jgi:hypothetical protein
MLQFRSTLLLAVLGAMSSVAMPAQTGVTSAGAISANADDSVLNVPYSAERRFTSVERLTDGTINRSKSGGSEARDPQGRTYSSGERHWTYLEGKKKVLKSEILYRIHDPVANTDTTWDSSSKEVKVIHWPQSTPADDASRVPCHEACNPDMINTLGTDVEKLGLKTIGGIVAEGTRSTYTIPAGKHHNEHSMNVVHESWYSPELKIVTLETNADPRTGRTRNELVGIVRGEPDVTRYQPPADHIIREFQMPQ